MTQTGLITNLVSCKVSLHIQHKHQRTPGVASGTVSLSQYTYLQSLLSQVEQWHSPSVDWSFQQPHWMEPCTEHHQGNSPHIPTISHCNPLLFLLMCYNITSQPFITTLHKYQYFTSQPFIINFMHVLQYQISTLYNSPHVQYYISTYYNSSYAQYHISSLYYNSSQIPIL